MEGMSSGTVYVKAPYDKVQARSAYVNSTPSIPEGATVVGGVYYSWLNTDEHYGFTGSNSWFTEIADGPTAAFFGVNSELAVQNYVNTYGSLDAVFQNWRDSEEYDIDQYQAFLNAIQKDAYGCATTA